MMLFNKPYPFPDELCISWTERMAKANGFRRTEELFAFVCPGSTAEIRKSFKIHHGRDCVRHPDLLCARLNISVYDFLAQTTVYPLFFPFFRREQQDKHILGIFRDANKKLIGNRTLLTKALYYCPLCKAEDLDRYNVSYLRRVHQIPGVHICPYHRCVLKNVDTDIYKYDGPISEIAQIHYINFCIQLLNEWLPCSVCDIYDAVKKRMKELKLNGTSLQKRLVNSGYQEFISANTETALIRLRDCQAMKNITTIIAICCSLFEDVDCLKKYLSAESFRTRIINWISSNQYELVSDYNDSFIELKHVSCGHVFYTTPHAILQGWRCPVCDANITDKEMFNRLLDNIDGGVYISVADAGALNNKEQIQHKPCGRVYSVSPAEFLNGAQRCKCSLLTEKQIKTVLHSHKQYKLLDFNAQNRTVALHNQNCGHEFELKFNVFKDNQNCPQCLKDTSKDKRSVDSFDCPSDYFKECVLDLVGDEYEVRSEYSNNKSTVQMFHRNCGHVYPMIPESFKRGVRCKCCTQPMSKNKFIKTVWMESDNRYRVKGFVTVTKAILEDVTTGEEITLEKALVLQELRRPTKSDILPIVGVRKIQNNKVTAGDIVMAHIAAFYNSGDDILLKEVKIPNLSYKKKEKAFSLLLRKGILEKKERGVYQLAE